MSDLTKIFKAYDIRGVVPDELDESIAEAVGAAFVRVHRSRLVRRGAVAQVESRPTGDYVIRLTDGREVAGSRRYRRPLLEP